MIREASLSRYLDRLPKQRLFSSGDTSFFYAANNIEIEFGSKNFLILGPPDLVRRYW